MRFFAKLIKSQDSTPSLSKWVMLVGVVMSTVLIVMDTVFNRRLDGMLFSIYTGVTVGANTVNKAISVNKDIKTAPLRDEKGI